MSIVTANNAAANVQAFGGFIAATNFIAMILRVVYGFYVYLPACQHMNDH